MNHTSCPLTKVRRNYNALFENSKEDHVVDMKWAKSRILYKSFDMEQLPMLQWNSRNCPHAKKTITSL